MFLAKFSFGEGPWCRRAIWICNTVLQAVSCSAIYTKRGGKQSNKQWLYTALIFATPALEVAAFVGFEHEPRQRDSALAHPSTEVLRRMVQEPREVFSNHSHQMFVRFAPRLNLAVFACTVDNMTWHNTGTNWKRVTFCIEEGLLQSQVFNLKQAISQLPSKSCTTKSSLGHIGDQRLELSTKSRLHPSSPLAYENVVGSTVPRSYVTRFRSSLCLLPWQRLQLEKMRLVVAQDKPLG